MTLFHIEKFYHIGKKIEYKEKSESCHDTWQSRTQRIIGRRSQENEEDCPRYNAKNF